MRADARRPLAGRSVVTTRERPGVLDSEFARAGADVVHVPLIETTDPDDGGEMLRTELGRLESYDWVVVTSPVGAERVMPAARGHDLRVATVGTKTAQVAERLGGRPVDVVPDRQLAVELVAAMPAVDAAGPSPRLLLAVADRADPATADALRARGYDVTLITAYRTMLRVPTWRERRAALAADAAVFASGSAAISWAEAIGAEAPVEVISIGPSTTKAATEHGLQVTATATDHSIDGLVETVIRTLGVGP
ncbi:MAG: uroporphyrinogen-III synthase [Ilumatobacter fluminis]|uniref:uroporphyrinogen-III synthase n=1 Tax=Ilumatobacter fluminis TaxID=467091 RepID=UPI0032EFBC5F